MENSFKREIEVLLLSRAKSHVKTVNCEIPTHSTVHRILLQEYLQISTNIHITFLLLIPSLNSEFKFTIASAKLFNSLLKPRNLS